MTRCLPARPVVRGGHAAGAGFPPAEPGQRETNPRALLQLPARCTTPRCERVFLPQLLGIDAGRCDVCRDLARAVRDAQRAARASHHRPRATP